MLLAYELELPADQDADAFESFLRDEYVGAVHHGPTRVGVVEDVQVFRADERRFLLHVTWSGGGTHWTLDDQDVAARFTGFGVALGKPATWHRVGGWDRADG